MSEAYDRIYDLRRDREYVERIQMATVQDSDFALEREHGLLGSKQWWAAIEDCAIETTRVDGTIVDVRVNPDNWPEFEVESIAAGGAGAGPGAGGERSTWALEGEVGRYRVGAAVRIEYVELRYANPAPGGPDTTRVVLGIWVEG